MRRIVSIMVFAVLVVLSGHAFAGEVESTQGVDNPASGVWYNDWTGQTFTDYQEYLASMTVQLPGGGEAVISKKDFQVQLGFLAIILGGLFFGAIIKAIL